MKKASTIILAIILALFFVVGGAADSAQAVGTVYYIDSADGNDSNTGTSPASAWKTLGYLNTVLAGTADGRAPIVAGDSLRFRRGLNYLGAAGVEGAITSSLVIPSDGTAGNPVRFYDYGSGVKPRIIADNNNFGVMFAGASHILFQSIDIEGAQDDIFRYTGGALDVEVRDSDIDGLDAPDDVFLPYGFSVEDGSNDELTIWDVKTANLAGGFLAQNFSSMNSLIISDSTFNSTGADGILIDCDSPGSGCSNLLIQNTFSNLNARSGLYINKVSEASIVDSTFNGNAFDGVDVYDSYNVSIDNIFARENGQTEGVATGPDFGVGLFYANTDNLLITNSSMNYNFDSGIASRTRNVNYGYLDVLSTESNAVELSNDTVNYNKQSGIYVGDSGEGVVITNVAASSNKDDGIAIHGAVNNVVVSYCLASDNGTDGLGTDGDGIAFVESTTGVVRNSRLINNLRTGISAVGQSRTTIQDNLLIHFTSGIKALLFLSDTGVHKVFNNTLYGGSKLGHGIEAGVYNGDLGITTASIINNIIYGFDTGLSVMHTEGTDVMGKVLMTQHRNLIFNNTKNLFGVELGNSIEADPLFVGASNGDFSLKSGSPAIDAGEDVSVAADYMDVSRQDDICTADSGSGTLTYYDIGFLEYTRVGSCPVVPITSPGATTTTTTTTPSGTPANTTTLSRTGPSAADFLKSLFDLRR